jgi:hypothetical protein
VGEGLKTGKSLKKKFQMASREKNQPPDDQENASGIEKVLVFEAVKLAQNQKAF